MGSEKSKYYKTKDELDKVFSFFGNFYSKGENNFRNLLVIVNSENKKKEVFDFEKGEYDALFVMMNPGGSRPNDDKHKRGDIFVGFDGPIKGMNKMVPAIADQTQYQIARIALKKGWKAVCILNLSDYANGNSSDFSKYLNKNSSLTANSIFDESRNLELSKVLSKLNAKNKKEEKVIYAAWGCKQEKHFIELIKIVKERIESMGFSIMGLPSEAYKEKILFRHPLPRTMQKQFEWLDNFVELIK